MIKILNGLGKIKCGAYEKINVEGIGLANDAITAKKIYVHGIFKGKKVRCTDLMNVEGIMGGDIQFGERTKFSAIFGNAILEKQESGQTSFVVEGELRADVVAVDIFNMRGRCFINRLEAEKIAFTKETQEKNKIVKNEKSVIGEIVCKRLIAYGLKAEKMVAEEVELYDACEIGTLICKKKTYCSPDCKIMNEREL